MKTKDNSAKTFRRSKFKEVWRRLKKSRTAMIGLFILLAISATALIGPVFIDYQQDVIKQNIRERLQGPAWRTPLARTILEGIFSPELFTVRGHRCSLVLYRVPFAVRPAFFSVLSPDTMVGRSISL